MNKSASATSIHNSSLLKDSQQLSQSQQFKGSSAIINNDSNVMLPNNGIEYILVNDNVDNNNNHDTIDYVPSSLLLSSHTPFMQKLKHQNKMNNLSIKGKLPKIKYEKEQLSMSFIKNAPSPDVFKDSENVLNDTNKKISINSMTTSHINNPMNKDIGSLINLNMLMRSQEINQQIQKYKKKDIVKSLNNGRDVSYLLEAHRRANSNTIFQKGIANNMDPLKLKTNIAESLINFNNESKSQSSSRKFFSQTKKERQSADSKYFEIKPSDCDLPQDLETLNKLKQESQNNSSTSPNKLPKILDAGTLGYSSVEWDEKKPDIVDNLLANSSQPVPNILKSLKNSLKTLTQPTSRREVEYLRDWLDKMIEKIHKEENMKLKDVFDYTQIIYSVCLHEIIRQVSIECSDRGQLLQRIWNAYIDFLEKGIQQNNKEKTLCEKEYLLHTSLLHNTYQTKLDEYIKQINDTTNKYKDIEGKYTMFKDDLKYFKKKIKKVEKMNKEYIKMLKEANQNNLKLTESNDHLKKIIVENHLQIKEAPPRRHCNCRRHHGEQKYNDSKKENKKNILRKNVEYKKKAHKIDDNYDNNTDIDDLSCEKCHNADNISFIIDDSYIECDIESIDGDTPGLVQVATDTRDLFEPVEVQIQVCEADLLNPNKLIKAEKEIQTDEITETSLDEIASRFIYSNQVAEKNKASDQGNSEFLTLAAGKKVITLKNKVDTINLLDDGLLSSDNIDNHTEKLGINGDNGNQIEIDNKKQDDIQQNNTENNKDPLINHENSKLDNQDLTLPPPLIAKNNEDLLLKITDTSIQSSKAKLEGQSFKSKRNKKSKEKISMSQTNPATIKPSLINISTKVLDEKNNPNLQTKKNRNQSLNKHLQNDNVLNAENTAQDNLLSKIEGIKLIEDIMEKSELSLVEKINNAIDIMKTIEDLDNVGMNNLLKIISDKSNRLVQDNTNYKNDQQENAKTIKELKNELSNKSNHIENLNKQVDEANQKINHLEKCLLDIKNKMEINEAKYEKIESVKLYANINNVQNEEGLSATTILRNSQSTPTLSPKKDEMTTSILSPSLFFIKNDELINNKNEVPIKLDLELLTQSVQNPIIPQELISEDWSDVELNPDKKSIQQLFDANSSQNLLNTMSKGFGALNSDRKIIKVILPGNNSLGNAKKISRSTNINIEVASSIITKIKSKKASNPLTKITILKFISAIYTEKVKQLGPKNQNPLYGFAYDYFINKYGLKKVAESKFIQMLESTLLYSNSLKIKRFSRLMGLDQSYDGVETEFYFNCYRLLDTIGQGNLIASNLGETYYISMETAEKTVNDLFEKKLDVKKMKEILNNISSMKILDSAQKIPVYVIDFENLMDKLMDIQVNIKQYVKEYLLDIFNAVDLNQDEYINYLEFNIAYKHIESERYDKDEVRKLFNNEYDMQLTDMNDEKVMSFNKFISLCFEMKIFEEDKQVKFMSSNNPRDEIQNLTQLENKLKETADKLRLRFIKSNSYTIELRNIIGKFYSSSKRKTKSKKALWMTYKLLDEESKKTILEYEANQLLPLDLLQLSKYLSKIDDYKYLEA